jgi:hypothetical protein
MNSSDGGGRVGHGLHNQIARVPPVTAKRFALPGRVQLELAVGFAGTACTLATLLTAHAMLRVPPRQFWRRSSQARYGSWRFRRFDHGGGAGVGVPDEL